MNVSASKLSNESNHANIVLIRNKKIHLHRCYQWYSIQSKENLMRVMKYEGECIKAMEWVKLYVNRIK